MIDFTIAILEYTAKPFFLGLTCRGCPKLKPPFRGCMNSWCKSFCTIQNTSIVDVSWRQAECRTPVTVSQQDLSEGQIEILIFVVTFLLNHMWLALTQNPITLKNNILIGWQSSYPMLHNRYKCWRILFKTCAIVFVVVVRHVVSSCRSTLLSHVGLETVKLRIRVKMP